MVLRCDELYACSQCCAQFIDVRLARMVLKGSKQGCLEDMMALVADISLGYCPLCLLSDKLGLVHMDSRR